MNTEIIIPATYRESPDDNPIIIDDKLNEIKETKFYKMLESL